MAIIIPSKNIYGVRNKKPYTNSIGEILFNKTIFTENVDEAELYNNKLSVSRREEIFEEGKFVSANLKGFSKSCMVDSFATPAIPNLFYKNGIQYLRESIDYSKTNLDIKFTCITKIGTVNYTEGQDGNILVDWSTLSITHQEEETINGYNVSKQASYSGTYNLTQTITISNDGCIAENKSKGTNKENFFAEPLYNFPYSFNVDGEKIQGQWYDNIKVECVGTETSSYPIVVGRYLSVELIAQENPNLMLYGTYRYLSKEIEDVSVSSENGNEKIVLDQNDFLQSLNAELLDQLFNKTISEYRKGKETATITCSLSNYYDEAKNLVISKDGSTSKIAFELYDEICPLIFDSNGNDIPMSYTPNNSAKTFVVLGSKIYYDGAIWQDLSIQEIASLSDLSYIVSDSGDYAICSGLNVIPTSIVDINEYATIEHNQYPVKEVGDNAFSNNQNIFSVDTGESVTIIGLESFYNCKKIASLTIGKNVETIFDSAFEGCEKIEELIIPNNVKDIFTYAFKGCTGVTNLTIGENVDSIGDYAFSGLTNANNIYYNAASPSYISPTSFLGTSGMLIVGDKVELLPRMAFASSNITHLEMPYNGACHTIEYGAFESCSTLQSIRIPKTVTKIEAYAFYGTSIKNIYYEGSLDDWSLIILSYEGNDEIDYSQFPEKFHFYS